MDQHVCLHPIYMLASELIDQGMNWWKAVFAIFLGNLIVLVPMLLPRRADSHFRASIRMYR